MLGPPGRMLVIAVCEAYLSTLSSSPAPRVMHWTHDHVAMLCEMGWKADEGSV